MTTTTRRPYADIDELADQLRYLAAINHRIKVLEEARDALQEKIKQALGDAEEGRVGGHPAVRWTVVNSSRLDTTRLREELPDIAERYSRASTSRRFTLVEGEEK